jgi:C-terminal processing protease CtpA/Prc
MGKARKKTLVTVQGKGDMVVLPVTAGTMSDLLYERWVRARAADVERLSGGRLGYVHIESMNDDSFRTIYNDILGKYNKCEGIVIDTRFNGGGRLHEDIEVLFSGEKYLTQVVRGAESCDMPSRRWNKPSIMIQCESNYSNAHGTPWVYSHKKIGRLVGAPVPGTMTSVNWVTMQDPTLIFGIPVVGYRTAEGYYLENTQLEPDFYVLNDPATVVHGEDAQLRTAVEQLLKEIDGK